MGTAKKLFRYLTYFFSISIFLVIHFKLLSIDFLYVRISKYIDLIYEHAHVDILMFHLISYCHENNITKINKKSQN